MAYEQNRIRICGLDYFLSESESMAGSCEHGNEYSGYMKGWEILNKLSTYLLLKTTLFHGFSFLLHFMEVRLNNFEFSVGASPTVPAILIFKSNNLY
jgi:hypothetical protein